MISVKELPGDDVSCKACSSWKREVLWQEYAVAVMCRWVPCRWCILGYCHYVGLLQSNLYCWNCMTCKYRHGLVVRLRDGNHSNLGSNPNRSQRSFAQKFTFLRYHYYIIITSTHVTQDRIPSRAAPTHMWSDLYRISVISCKIRRNWNNWEP